MKKEANHTLFAVGIIAAIAGLFLVFALPHTNNITGFVVGGGTQSSGEQQKGNPTYGIVKGYATYTISDNGVIVNTEIPSTSLTVYFVTVEEDIDWDQTITCSTSISGTITNIDADDASARCASANYDTPTAYTCTATKVGSGTTTIYKTTTKISSGNEGCFAAKIPTGTFDIYV